MPVSPNTPISGRPEAINMGKGDKPKANNIGKERGIEKTGIANQSELKERWVKKAKRIRTPEWASVSLESGSCLSSHAVASTVLSVYEGLTSVFGMRTGGTPQLNHRKGLVFSPCAVPLCGAVRFQGISTLITA